jgi:hypothetical protein
MSDRLLLLAEAMDRRDPVEGPGAFPMEFASIDDAKAYFQQYAVENNFKLNTKGFEAKKKRTVLVCSQSGTFKSRSLGCRKNTSSSKTGCKYRIVLKGERDGPQTLGSVSDAHNHDLNMVVKKEITRDEADRLWEMRQAGVAPRMQLSTILNHSEDRGLGKRDIYNLNAKKQYHDFT